nr:hypothetical protein [Tanacetum cinerariifolium]
RSRIDHFCQAVMKIYGPEFLRKPTVTDIEKVYRHHKEKHGFSRILESLDYMDWSGSVVRTLLKRDMLDVIMVRIRSFCWKLLRRKTYGYGMLSSVLLGRTTTSIPFI